MKSYQEFFAEMKRRKVFRVMGMYGAVGFVVLQAGELLVNTFSLPPQFQTGIGVLIVLGFPVAIVLAWAFEMTADGVQRTGEADAADLEEITAAPAASRWPSGLLALFGTVALAAGIWLSLDAQQADESAGPGAAAEVRLAFVDPSDDPRPSIAVLPFVNMSPDPDQVYFSDGMTEEILNVLAKIQDLRVAARTSTFALRDRELTATQWGDTLQVGYLVEGSVRKSGDMVRITAQLIDTSNGSHLWSDNFDRPLANIFQIQSEIAEKIADALAVPLGLGEGASLTTPTADLEAYDLYLAGRQQMRARGEGVAEAVKLFEAAIARDSAWAPPWAGLAESQALIPYYSGETQTRDSVIWGQHLGAAETAARRALELDPDNASALVALGNVYRDSWDWERAEGAYLSALATDPDNVEAHQQYAEFLHYVGRLGEAIQEAERALALDRSPIRLNTLGYISNTAGRHDEAIALLEEGIRLDPDRRVLQLRRNLESAYWNAERWDQWWDFRTRTANLFLENAPDSARAASLERRAELLAMWPEGTPPPKDLDIEALRSRFVSRTRLALLFGKNDLAMKILEESHEGLPPYGQSGLLSPTYDPIRDDPRFQAILAKRGLAGFVRVDPIPDSTSAP